MRWLNAEESDLTPSTYCSSIDVTCTHVMDYNDVFPDSLKNETASEITDTLVSATEKNSGFCSIVLLFLLLLPLSFGLFFSFTRRPLFAPYLLIYDRAVFLPSIIHGSLIESVYRYTRRRLLVTIRSQFRACILNFTRAFSAFSFDNFSGNTHGYHGSVHKVGDREALEERNITKMHALSTYNLRIIARLYTGHTRSPFPSLSIFNQTHTGSYRREYYYNYFWARYAVNNYLQCNTRIKRNRKPRPEGRIEGTIII